MHPQKSAPLVLLGKQIQEFLHLLQKPYSLDVLYKGKYFEYVQFNYYY